MAVVVKNAPANARGARDVSSVPGLGRSPGVGNDNLLQNPCLGNPMDRGGWWATVHRISKESNMTESTLHTRMYSLLHGEKTEHFYIELIII